MTIISDLPRDLVEEILSSVSITSLRAVRSTCKRWNAISKDQRFTKKHCDKASKEEFLVTITHDYSQPEIPLRLDLNNIKDMPSSINVIGKMISPVNIYQVLQFEGLFLLKTNRFHPTEEAENSGVVVCNPYLGQSRFIEPINNPKLLDFYAIGYDNKNNHKILRFFSESDKNVELYNFKSNSWRVLDITSKCRIFSGRVVSLKGNTYFLACNCCEDEPFVIGFDFTTERFGSRLHLPVEVDNTINVSSCVREEQLAVLLYMNQTRVMEIWITTKIEPNAASWSNFFKVNVEPLTGWSFIYSFRVDSFFIEKEKKVAVVSGESNHDRYGNSYDYDVTSYSGWRGWVLQKNVFRKGILLCSKFCADLVITVK